MRGGDSEKSEGSRRVHGEKGLGVCHRRVGFVGLKYLPRGTSSPVFLVVGTRKAVTSSWVTGAVWDLAGMYQSRRHRRLVGWEEASYRVGL